MSEMLPIKHGVSRLHDSARSTIKECTRRSESDLSIYTERVPFRMLTQLCVLQLSQLSLHVQITAVGWRRRIMSCSSPPVHIKQMSFYVPLHLVSLTSVFMCFVWIWEQTASISLYSINWLVCITEMENVYCAVRTGYLYVIQYQLV